MNSLARTRLPAGPGASWWGFLLAGLGYGAFTALAMPPLDVWPLALTAMIPLAWAGCRASRRPWFSALLCGIGSLPMWVFEHFWIRNVTGPGFPLVCLYLAAYPAIFVWIIARARRTDWPIPMCVVVPFVWTALEVIRGEWVFDGYAWFLLGHPLIDAPLLAAPAAVFGTYFVSFLCAALAGAVVDSAGWSGVPRSWGGIGALALVLGWPTLGLIGQLQARPSAQARAVFRVGVVQTNLPQDNKMGWSIADRQRDMQRFLDLTRHVAAIRPAPDVIAWPETMFPGRTLSEPAARVYRDLGVHWIVQTPEGERRVSADSFRENLLRTQNDLGIPMLIGSAELEGDIAAALSQDRRDGLIRRFNSVVMLDHGEAVSDRYDKIELMPFGERIPHLWRWPSLQQAVLNLGAAGMSFDLTPGTRARGLDVPVRRSDFPAGAVTVATPICCEATRADLCRRLVRGGDSGKRSLLMLSLSNDGWFGSWDGGRWQHLLDARWRCVELALPMVRCVNTGVSCHIDASGRIVTDRIGGAPVLNAREEGVFVATVPVDPGHSPTTFERLGMIPAYTITLVGCLGTVVLWRRARRTGAP
ncbi:MAG TPA: apolipoprotein N-acyltransferase [Phycisphaerales bacterium]|nr:apolipoprotein N-acyltransferase [Phycisphaerales bacterium]